MGIGLQQQQQITFLQPTPQSIPAMTAAAVAHIQAQSPMALASNSHYGRMGGKLIV